MKPRWALLLACLVAFAPAGFACTDGTGDVEQEASSGDVRVPGPSDAAADALLSDADAGPCSDCEYFLDTCSPEAFCPNGPFDANDPNRLDPRTMINVIRGRSATDIWAVGAAGALVHFDGSTWTRSDAATQETIRALWLPEGAEVAFAGQSSRLFARGLVAPDAGEAPSAGGWVAHDVPYGADQVAPPGLIGASWGAPDAEWFWGASIGTAGALWRLRRTSSGEFEGATGISSSACQMAGCQYVFGVHGSSPSALWAVGSKGATVRIKDAAGPSPTGKSFNSQTMNVLSGVWEASDANAWSVGAVGTIRHYAGDPNAWEIVTDVPTNRNLNAVWGFSSSDVWAVGDSGVVLHYDGERWTRVKVAGLGSDRPKLTTVWGPAAGHVWIGGQGIILSLGGTP